MSKLLSLLDRFFAENREENASLRDFYNWLIALEAYERRFPYETGSADEETVIPDGSKS